VEQKSTDAQLLEQVRNSDMGAFKALFERYQPVVFRQALFQTGEIDLTHDIVQETFIKVWEHRKSIKPNLSFPAYLLRISRNLICDIVKHRKIRERTDKFIPHIALSENDDPSEALHLNILQEQITTIINRDLPSRCREIFLLSRFEGKTHREIADIFNLSVRTVENQIAHALKVLRKKLDRN
jgi:RNA polymerase sigma-70 factor (ECF subfamily)